MDILHQTLLQRVAVLERELAFERNYHEELIEGSEWLRAQNRQLLHRLRAVRSEVQASHQRPKELCQLEGKSFGPQPSAEVSLPPRHTPASGESAAHVLPS